MQISDPETHRALQTIAAHLDAIKGTNAKAADAMSSLSITTGK